MSEQGSVFTNVEEFRKRLGVGVADASDGLLFSAQKKAKISSDRHFLVIGVGGSGCQTVETLKRQLVSKVDDWDKRVAFLAVDTDQEELRGRRFSNDEIFSLKTHREAKRRWFIEDNRIPSVRKWVLKTFKGVDFDGNGAGKYRQAARAMLYDWGITTATTDNRLVEQIETRISKLNILPDGDLNVYIVLGLSGGTGSGLVLDIADRVRRAVLTKEVGCKITGYFYLPDTIKEYGGVNTVALNAMFANGYAALRELDFFCAASQRVGYSSRVEGTDAENAPKYDYVDKLYDMAFLISGRGQKPATMARESVVESLLNLLAEVPKSDADTDDKKFLSSSFLSNKDRAREELLINLGQATGKVYPEDMHDYCSIGVAVASAREDIIKAYAIDHLVQSLYKEVDHVKWRKEPIPQNEAGLHMDGLIIKQSQILGKNSGTIRNVCYDLDWDDGERPLIKEITGGLGPQDVARKFSAPSIERKALKVMETFFKDKLDDFYKKAKEILLQFGPLGLVNMWEGNTSSGEGDPEGGIKGRLEQLQKDWTNAYDTGAKQRLWQNENNRLVEPSLMTRGLILAGQEKGAAWCEACENWQRELVISKVAGSIFDVDGGQLLLRYIQPIFAFIQQVKAFHSVLEDMQSSYANLGNAFDSPEDDENSFHYDILGGGNASNWARGVVNKAVQSAQLQKRLREEMVTSFVSEPELWGTTEVDPNTGYLPARRLYDEVLNKVLTSDTSRAVDVSMVKYLVHVTGGEVDDAPLDAAKLAQEAKEIVERTVKQAKPLFITDGPINTQEHKYLLIPANWDGIRNGTEIYDALKAAAEAEKVNVYPSSLSGRIVCYSLSCAQPLYTLAQIGVWEQAYDTSIREKIHSNESDLDDFNPETGLRWEDYPALAMRKHKLLDDIDQPETREEIFLKNQFGGIFKRAEQLGLLRAHDDGTGNFSYRFYNVAGLRVPQNYKLEPGHQYMNRDSDGLFMAGAPLIDYLIETLGGGSDKFTHKIVLHGNEVLTAGQTTEASARSRAQRVLRRHVPMYIDVKKSIRLLEPLVEEVKLANIPIIPKSLLDLPARLYAYNYLRADIGDESFWRLYTSNVSDRDGSTQIMRMIRPYEKGKLRALYDQEWKFLILSEKLMEMFKDMEQRVVDGYKKNCKTMHDDVHAGAVPKNDLLMYVRRLQPIVEEANKYIAQYGDTNAIHTKAARSELTRDWDEMSERERTGFWNNSLAIYECVREYFNYLKGVLSHDTTIT